MELTGCFEIAGETELVCISAEIGDYSSEASLSPYTKSVLQRSVLDCSIWWHLTTAAEINSMPPKPKPQPRQPPKSPKPPPRPPKLMCNA